MKWNDLSMSDKADYIRLGVQEGIYNLNHIKESYNNYMKDEGPLYDISDIKGKVILKDTKGNRTTYESGKEAMQAIGKGYYYIPVSDIIENNNLPEVTVVANKSEKKIDPANYLIDKIIKNDPIRDSIFKGKYGTRKFEPTLENIKHFLDLYESDKRIDKGYGMSQYGKVLGVSGAGAGVVLGAAYGLPYMINTIKSPITRKLIGEAAGGMATHMTANETYKTITGHDQGYMADAADWIADRYEDSYLQDYLNKGSIYLPGDKEGFKAVFEYADPAAFTTKPLTTIFNSSKKLIGDITYRSTINKSSFVKEPRIIDKVQINDSNVNLRVGGSPLEEELTSLDWSDWSKGGKISKRHLQEYARIEKESKLNNTWLKMPDGSYWKGDPRSWVQMQSEDFKKFMTDNNRSVLVFPNTIFVTRSPNKFDSFKSDYIGTNFDKHNYSGDYGSGFYFHPQSSVKEGVFDHGVTAYGENIYNVVTNITNPYTPNNIADDQFSTFSSLFNTTKQPEWMKKFDSLYSVPTNITTDLGSYKPELVIKNPKSIKSIIGNNGNFSTKSSNIYKSIIPFIFGSALTTLNN